MASPTPKKRYEVSTWVNFTYEFDASDNFHERGMMIWHENQVQSFVRKALERVETSNQIDIVRTELWDREIRDEDNPITRI